MTDWKSEFKSSIRSLNDLNSFFSQSPIHFDSLPKDFDEEKYPIFIPRKVANEILNAPPHSSLWKQFIPNQEEIRNKIGFIDPIGDQLKEAAPQLIHRYTNRALFLPTTICPINCRYCFRKNELNSKIKLFKKDFDKTTQYLKEHSEINEIILTGGDPFILDTNILEQYLKAFSEIAHLEYLRFHTRVPVSLPSRFDSKIISMLKEIKEPFSQLHIVIHINHSDELNEENRALLRKLSSNFTLLSQSVLLKDVNNNQKHLSDLFYNLIDLGVRPYYLHHPDKVKGAKHFELDIEEGRSIYQQLRQRMPGWALPQYVIDSPEASGKKNIS